MTASTPTTVSTAPRALEWTRAGALALLLGLPLLIPFFNDLWLRLAVLLIVGWAVPGFLLARGWRLPGVTPHGLILAAWGLGVCWLMGGALLAHYLPGPLLEWQLWGVYILGGVALTMGLRPRAAAELDSETDRQQGRPASVWQAVRTQPEMIAGLCLLVAALLLRLPGLGYHEFHTDEVVLVRQAGLSIAGHLTALAEHTKGPGEIAVTLAVYRALGSIDEGTARLPFALMSVGSVLATGWLGLRMFSGALGRRTSLWLGLWAGLLLLFNGFALGLSRIAQYQPGILLLSALAVWAMWEFARSGRPRWLSLAGVFSAFGMVLHYEFGLLPPVLLCMAILGWGKSTAPRDLWRAVLMTGGFGALLLAAAYVPPLFNPYFSTTQSYLSNRLGETLVFNVPFFVEMGTFYNSTYFFFGLIGLVAGGTWLGLRPRAGATWMFILPTFLLTVWWLPFFVLYIFVVRYPGTHFYQMMTAWSLLGAMPLAVLTQAVWRLARPRADAHSRSVKPWRAVSLMLATAGVVAWLAISVFYLHLLFFRQNPEYLVNHEQEGLALYWAPYPVPQKPRFGFPIYAGWKTIGLLGEWGYLTGTYSSNDRAWGLRTWYRAQLTWIEQWDGPDAPDYIFSAVHIQEENLTYHDGYRDSYHRVGDVRFRGEPRIELWAKAPLPVPYVSFDAEHFDAVFLDELARLPFPAASTASTTAQSLLSTSHRVRVEVADARLEAGEVANLQPGDSVELTAAYLPARGWQPGQAAHLALVWEPQAALQQDYKLFVHVADDTGRPLAQWDGYSGLNTSRTTEWPVGEPFVDHVLLPIPDDMPAGDYTLLVGLYDPETGARLGDRALTVARIPVP